MIICRFSLYPYIEAVVESEAKNRLTALCAEKMTEVLSGGDYGYEDLIRLSYTQSGTVASASVNTVTLNLLRYRIASAMLTELKKQSFTIKVPLSNLFGIVFFSPLSGGVSVTVECADSMRASFVSEFEECGINQTRHVIFFEFTLDSYFLLPVRYRKLSLVCRVSAAETLIVGEVPDSFTDIDRLTDDLSEIDIDDAVDFGDVVY